eukprot:352199-Chlamydomonas_euryale.AAC.10
MEVRSRTRGAPDAARSRVPNMASGAPPPPDKAEKVSRQAMNKIVYKITMIAQEECAQAIEDFNLCAKGRAFSMLWACRGKYHSSQDCVHRL